MKFIRMSRLIIYQVILIRRSLMQFNGSFKNFSLIKLSNTKITGGSNQISRARTHLKIRFYLYYSTENIQILIYWICLPIARFSYLIVYRRYYILLQRSSIFIFTFCSVWLKPEVYGRERETEIERNLLCGGASHLQERVRRESAAHHTVKSMMIGYSHARERRYSIDINTHATGANVIEKPRSFARTANETDLQSLRIFIADDY